MSAPVTSGEGPDCVRVIRLSFDGFSALQSNEPMSLLLRVPKFVRARGRMYSTIDEHNAAFQKDGRVAFGKFGSRLSKRVFSELENGIAAGRAQLIVAVWADGAFCGFAAQALNVGWISLHRAPQMACFPGYYATLDDWPTSYVILTSALKPIDLRRFSLVSNRRPVLDVLRSCRTTNMLVQKVHLGRNL